MSAQLETSRKREPPPHLNANVYGLAVTRRDIEVVVVGAGVSGLTTAVCLAEAGFAVSVRATLPPGDTTSCSGGPHLVTDPKVAEWADHALTVFTEMAPKHGVRMVAGVEASRTEAEPPPWMEAASGFATLSAADLPDGYVTGWEYTVPIIDMPVYLGYLTQRLSAAGGTLEYGARISAEQLPDLARVTVNCTGLGSRDLVADDSLLGVRGDLIAVDNPGIKRFFAEHTDEMRDQTYILPQGPSHVLLGGTAREGDTSRAPDAEIAAGIIARCAAIEPSLAGATVREHRVGIRPSRPLVRVAREDFDTWTLVHNYGHGGGGVSLSWGCAEEVLELVEKAVANH
jgi:D-amino-acid oxidase